MEPPSGPSEIQFCLFNCDRTFPLGAVAELLNAVKDSLPYTFRVEEHPFPLSGMRALSEEVSSLKMDYAIFVVHAHESRLSINEENAGIGYAVLFKALLRATGNKVLIVIGGDDNYKNQDEEDTRVLSRWAKHKIMSQFTEDFFDGSMSFIFSWEEKHRPIHEEALLHFLLPGNEGIKFQPKPRLTAPEPVVPPKKDDGRGETDNEGEKFQPTRQAEPEPTVPPKDRPAEAHFRELGVRRNEGVKSRGPEVVGEDFEEKNKYGATGKTAETAGGELQKERRKQELEMKESHYAPAEASNTATKKPEDATEPQVGDKAKTTGLIPRQEKKSIKTSLRYGELGNTDQQSFQVPGYIIEGLRDQWKHVESATVEIRENESGYDVHVTPVSWWQRWCTLL